MELLHSDLNLYSLRNDRWKNGQYCITQTCPVCSLIFLNAKVTIYKLLFRIHFNQVNNKYQKPLSDDPPPPHHHHHQPGEIYIFYSVQFQKAHAKTVQATALPLCDVTNVPCLFPTNDVGHATDGQFQTS